MTKLRIVFISVISIFAFAFTLALITNLVVITHNPFSFRVSGDDSTWISFFGELFGSVLASIAGFLVAYFTIKFERENSVKQFHSSRHIEQLENLVGIHLKTMGAINNALFQEQRIIEYAQQNRPNSELLIPQESMNKSLDQLDEYRFDYIAKLMAMRPVLEGLDLYNTYLGTINHFISLALDCIDCYPAIKKVAMPDFLIGGAENNLCAEMEIVTKNKKNIEEISNNLLNEYNRLNIVFIENV